MVRGSDQVIRCGEGRSKRGKVILDAEDALQKKSNSFRKRGVEGRGGEHNADHASSTLHDSPIHVAAERGDIAECEALLKRGANVNFAGAESKRPLHYAVIGMHEDIVALLLKHRADTNVQDEQGYTPLHYAALLDMGSTLETLLRVDKTDVHAQDRVGETVLHVAIKAGSADAARVILKHITSCSESGADGHASTNSERASSLLLDRLDSSGNSAMYYARKSRAPEVKDELLPMLETLGATEIRGEACTPSLPGTPTAPRTPTLTTAPLSMRRKMNPVPLRSRTTILHIPSNDATDDVCTTPTKNSLLSPMHSKRGQSASKSKWLATVDDDDDEEPPHSSSGLASFVKLLSPKGSRPESPRKSMSRGLDSPKGTIARRFEISSSRATFNDNPSLALQQRTMRSAAMEEHGKQDHGSPVLGSSKSTIMRVRRPSIPRVGLRTASRGESGSGECSASPTSNVASASRSPQRSAAGGGVENTNSRGVRNTTRLLVPKALALQMKSMDVGSVDSVAEEETIPKEDVEAILQKSGTRLSNS
mmetsp:Transcript_10835/g.29036  ORF Transcript_10835/g.29036 Transcript_10835/m.29036 type:complete len:537 (+) Transcript_10835:82-1692(+)